MVGGMMTLFLACGGGQGRERVQRRWSAHAARQPLRIDGLHCDEKTPCEIEVNADGTLDPPANVACASITVTGCTTRGTDCTYTSNGQSFTENFEITFAEESVAATGTTSITGMGNGVTGTVPGQSCSSTYDVSATRQ